MRIKALTQIRSRVFTFHRIGGAVFRPLVSVHSISDVRRIAVNEKLHARLVSPDRFLPETCWYGCTTVHWWTSCSLCVMLVISNLAVSAAATVVLIIYKSYQSDIALLLG